MTDALGNLHSIVMCLDNHHVTVAVTVAMTATIMVACDLYFDWPDPNFSVLGHDRRYRGKDDSKRQCCGKKYIHCVFFVQSVNRLSLCINAKISMLRYPSSILQR